MYFLALLYQFYFDNLKHDLLVQDYDNYILAMFKW